MSNTRSKLLQEIPDEDFETIMGQLIELRAKHPAYPDHELLIYLAYDRLKTIRQMAEQCDC